MYHFAQLREEVGDLGLIGLMAERLMNTAHLSAPMAVRAAADQFEILGQIQNGEPVFSDMRTAKGLGRMADKSVVLTIESPKKIDSEEQ
jgi:hypothetical protein